MAIESIQVNKALFDGLCKLIPSLRLRPLVKLVLRMDINSLPTLELTEHVLPSSVATRNDHTTKPTTGTVTTCFALITLKEKEASNGG